MELYYLQIKMTKWSSLLLSRSLSPTMVTEYTLKLIDKALLRRKLKEYTEIAEEMSAMFFEIM